MPTPALFIENVDFWQLWFLDLEKPPYGTLIWEIVKRFFVYYRKIFRLRPLLQSTRLVVWWSKWFVFFSARLQMLTIFRSVSKNRWNFKFRANNKKFCFLTTIFKQGFRSQSRSRTGIQMKITKPMKGSVLELGPEHLTIIYKKSFDNF